MRAPPTVSFPIGPLRAVCQASHGAMLAPTMVRWARMPR